MDAKITLSFDEEIISRAKDYAQKQGISLSRFTEILLRKATAINYYNIEDMPVADWVSVVSEGGAEYITKPRKRKDLNDEFYNKK